MRIRLHALTRDLHSYLGSFLSPFVLVFAASVLLLNHPGIPLGASSGSRERTVQMDLPEGLDAMDAPGRVQIAQQILQRVGISGEIGFVVYSAERKSLSIPITKPGYEASVVLRQETGLATVTERRTGFGDALIFLHKMPGPHLANIRGNWPVTRAWGWMADGTAWLLLFLSVTGIYLWFTLKAERRIGVILILAGAVSFVWATYAICS